MALPVIEDTFEAEITGQLTEVSVPVSGIQEGELLLAWGMTRTTSGAPEIEAPPGWTLRAAAHRPTTGGMRLYAWTRRATSADAAASAYAFKVHGPEGSAFAIHRISGASQTSPVAAAVGLYEDLPGSGASTVYSPAVTTSVDECLVLRAISVRSRDMVITIPEDHTLVVDDLGWGGSTMSKFKVAGASQPVAGDTGTAAFTLSGQHEPIWITLAIAPEGSPSGHAPVLAGDTSASGAVGIPFRFAASLASGDEPVSWSAAGLPAGLAIDAETGLISGTPVATGTSSVTITATSAAGTAAHELEISIAPYQSPAATMLRLMGVGGVTASSAVYRVRTSKPARVAIEYSTSSDLSGSQTSPGVTTLSQDNCCGGETITGLSPSTTYYYSIVLDGVRVHEAPFPRFKTFPEVGSDTPLKIAFSSCQGGPSNEVFASIGAENPDLFLHLGDFGYHSSTNPVSQRNALQNNYGGDFGAHIVTQMPVERIWSDHDYGPNNSNGDAAGKEHSLKAFKEFTPTYELANPDAGIWRSFRIGMAEVFLIDSRYQCEGTRLRFPSSSGTHTADAGSGGASLVLRASDSPSALEDYYRSWYVDIGGLVRRVTAYDAATRTCTLDAPAPGLEEGSAYFMRRASRLDMDMIENGQVDWLIQAMNASTARWKLFVTEINWNASIANSDKWGGYDPDQCELRYILQNVTAKNVIVLSADAHFGAIDDGTNSVWPEITASPLAEAPHPLEGTWSHGGDDTGGDSRYGVVELARESATLTVRRRDGSTSPLVTPLVVPYEGSENTSGDSVIENIPGLVLDLDPHAASYEDSAGTIPATLGGAVGRVDDRSGGGYHATQDTTAAKPTLQMDGFGWHYLATDGVDDRLTIAGVPLTGTSGLTVALVMQWDGAITRGTSALSMEADGAVAFNAGLSSSLGVQPRAYDAAGAVLRSRTAATPEAGGDVVTYVMTWDGASVMNVYRGGVLDNGSTSGAAGSWSTAGKDIHIGWGPESYGQSGAKLYLQGRLYRVLVYDRALTSDESQELGGHLEQLYAKPPADAPNRTVFWLKHDEESGTRADVLGTHDFEPSGDVQAVEGVRGGASAFTKAGAGHLVRSEGVSGFDPSLPWTFITRLYLEDVSKAAHRSGGVFRMQDPTGTFDGIQIHLHQETDQEISFRLAGEGDTVFFAGRTGTFASLTAGAWHTLRVECDGAITGKHSVRVYLDNAPAIEGGVSLGTGGYISSAVMGVPLVGGPVFINDSGQHRRYNTGRYDDTALINRHLTAAEIDAYESGGTYEQVILGEALPAQPGAGIRITLTASPDDGAGEDDVHSYVIEGSSDGGQSWQVVGTVPATQSATYTFDHEGGTASWLYRAAAVDQNGARKGAYSQTAAPVNPLRITIVSITAEPGGGPVVVVAEITGDELVPPAASDAVLDGGVGAAASVSKDGDSYTFTWTSVPVGSYTLTITATGGTHSTEHTAGVEVSELPDLEAPVIEDLAATASVEQVTLSWTYPADEDLVEARIYRGISSGFERGAGSLIHTVDAPEPGSAGSYTDTGLTGGTTYYYVIETDDDSDNTGVSNEASATPQAALLPKFETLTDAFEGAELDPAKWTILAEDAPADIAVTGGQLHLTIPDNASDRYMVIETAEPWDLTDSFFCFEIASPLPQLPETAYFQADIRIDDGNLLYVYYGEGYQHFWVTGQSAGTTLAATDLAYDPDEHRWIGFAGEGADLVVYTSPDGEGWSEILRWESAPLDMTNLKARLHAGTWGAAPSPGVIVLDNVNLPSKPVGTPPSFTDTFDGAALDANKWEVTGAHPENITVSDGQLRIYHPTDEANLSIVSLRTKEALDLSEGFFCFELPGGWTAFPFGAASVVDLSTSPVFEQGYRFELFAGHGQQIFGTTVFNESSQVVQSTNAEVDPATIKWAGFAAEGDDLVAYTSEDGAVWTERMRWASVPIDRSALYVHFAVYTYMPLSESVALVVDNVNLAASPPAPAPPVPRFDFSDPRNSMYLATLT